MRTLLLSPCDEISLDRTFFLFSINEPIASKQKTRHQMRWKYTFPSKQEARMETVAALVVRCGWAFEMRPEEVVAVDVGQYPIVA